MAQDKPATPEKQLLNLIEKQMHQGASAAGRDAGATRASPLSKATLQYQSRSFFSLGALKGRISFFKGKFKGDAKTRALRGIDLGVVNGALEGLIIILAGYFIFSFVMSLMALNKGVSLRMKIEKTGEIKSSQVASLLKASSYYLEKARVRDIFKMQSAESKEVKNLVAEKVTNAKETLRLVGISWSDDPDIMIEDTVSKRTYFLKRGQAINEDIKIKAVFKDKVVLECQGEEITLK